MSPLNLVDAVQHTLESGPSTLEQLVAEHASLWQQLDWREEQVRLWLACLPGVRRCDLPTGERAYELEAISSRQSNSLADELVALLEKAGRPMPLTQLMGKLAAGMVVTEPMLRTAAMQDARLEFKGPLLKLA
ncbi:hypothetical protein [Pseudomonas frederiksbergensis]|uniref:Uncharacterized protein n=1 Tax=Pseudomonas frederiksbergensis TaxID=104087 RepID=A0A423KL06_9PSED|nr:hypothetical protein [Pseudomonas frederiksbergensis]RON54556.1 hypothetical protein BK665_09495 [Pseudomonas frederiksbergensis]